jgi:hypothetical protein
VAEGGAGGGAARLTRPAVVFSALGVAVTAAVLLTPRDARAPGDTRLTTRSPGPQGARGLHDVAARLGWRPVRLEAPLPPRPRADAVYAVLAPVRQPTAAEIHRLLEAVRAGAGLLVVPARGSALADSLGVAVSAHGGVVVPPFRPACPRGSPGPQAITWANGRIHSWWLTARRPLGPGAETFVAVRHAPVRVERATEPGEPDEETELRGDSVRSPAALGFALGRGRVVAVADPDLLRNDVIRVCRWGAGVAAVRMLAWLGAGVRADGGARTLLFDEYHQGFSARGGGATIVWRGVWQSPGGRAAVQAVAAALVLLLALGPRPLAPRSRARLQRRSALEHVGALARAYEQAGATRTAARMLTRGLRRRHRVAAPTVAPAGAADAEFLAAVAARDPALAADAARVRRALDRAGTPAELLAVGQAVARIDAALRRPGSTHDQRPAPAGDEDDPLRDDS